MGEGEQGSSEADGEGGDVMAEVEKERGEQGSKVKQKLLVNIASVMSCHGQVMSPKISDWMFQRSQVSGVALCMSKVKVPSVSQSVSESVSE